jgi:hypothetical protein
VENKTAWDPRGDKKEKLRAHAAERLPGLEVRSGGSTSLDVTRKGIDKAYGLKKIINRLGITRTNVLFIGDRLAAGGNDYPVKANGHPMLRRRQLAGHRDLHPRNDPNVHTERGAFRFCLNSADRELAEDRRQAAAAARATCFTTTTATGVVRQQQ